MKRTGLQALKFGLVGVANTALGLTVILVAMTVFGAPPVLANAIGYAAGLCLSFYGNTRWTFGQQTSWGKGARFLAAFGLSYLVNIFVLLTALDALGIAPVGAQVLAVVSYTAVFFILSKTFVYSEPSQ